MRRAPGTGLAPNMGIMPTALIFGAAENFFINRIKLRGGIPVEMPMIGSFDLRSAELAACIMSWSEIAAFCLVALIPLMDTLKLANRLDQDHNLTALYMRFAALESLWMTTLVALDNGLRDEVADALC